MTWHGTPATAYTSLKSNMSCIRRGLSSLPLAVLLILPAHGQDAPKPTDSPAPQTSGTNAAPDTLLKKRTWVKPFSFGVSLAVLGQAPIQPGSSFTEPRTNYTIDSITGAGGYRIGWGGQAQVRLPNKFAFAGSVLLHKSAHGSTTDTYDGIDNPNTPLDDRIHTTIEESSIVNYWDYAFMLRRYTKDHEEAGHRAFFGVGFNFRDVRKIRTSRETTIGADTIADTKPVVPDRDMGRGIVGAIGAQFMDDFGFKIVPEFRFTRWLQPTFSSGSVMSRKNQFEAIVSITF